MLIYLVQVCVNFTLDLYGQIEVRLLKVNYYM